MACLCTPRTWRLPGNRNRVDLRRDFWETVTGESGVVGKVNLLPILHYLCSLMPVVLSWQGGALIQGSGCVLHYPLQGVPTIPR